MRDVACVHGTINFPRLSRRREKKRARIAGRKECLCPWGIEKTVVGSHTHKYFHKNVNYLSDGYATCLPGVSSHPYAFVLPCDGLFFLPLLSGQPVLHFRFVTRAVHPARYFITIHFLKLRRAIGFCFTFTAIPSIRVTARNGRGWLSRLMAEHLVRLINLSGGQWCRVVSLARRPPHGLLSKQQPQTRLNLCFVSDEFLIVSLSNCEQ